MWPTLKYFIHSLSLMFLIFKNLLNSRQAVLQPTYTNKTVHIIYRY